MSFDNIDAASFNNLFITRLDTSEGLEKAAAADNSGLAEDARFKLLELYADTEDAAAFNENLTTLKNTCDDQELLDMYREMLAQLPSKPEIVTASSGARAIALLEQQEFTLLITDLNMPKMDGITFLRSLRSRGSQRRSTRGSSRRRGSCWPPISRRSPCARVVASTLSPFTQMPFVLPRSST